MLCDSNKMEDKALSIISRPTSTAEGRPYRWVKRSICFKVYARKTSGWQYQTVDDFMYSAGNALEVRINREILHYKEVLWVYM
jgi:hypothetical protein